MDSVPPSLDNVSASLSKSRLLGDVTSESEPEVPEQEEKTLYEHLNLDLESNPYREFDSRRNAIRRKIKEKFKEAPKTILDLAEEEKPAIEKRLEDTDKVLSELLVFGNEIITNIRVANEKRELLRREYEELKRSDLQAQIKKESIEALARYNDIVARWSELGELKEPMVMFNRLEEQKNRIIELMNSKDEMIMACQVEIDRMNDSFQENHRKQHTDISSLVERADGQVELLNDAYKHHLELLEQTIESERQTIALKERTKWDEFYNTMQDSEQYKLVVAKQKKTFYTNEIKRISMQQEEITRATRIRLEKDAEMLEYELRNTRNQVLMNSEKLDYNYQVLQKRNEENVVINNQQKRRVGKLSEMISDMKKRIQTQQTNAEHSIHKLTTDIQKLHDSITDLEKKSERFRQSNRRKFFSIWSINYEEIRALIEKVFDIDRILYEQQLGIEWTRPNVDLEELPAIAKEKELLRGKASKPVASQHTNALTGLKSGSARCLSSKEKLDLNKKQASQLASQLAQKAEDERKRQEHRVELRLLRNILRKIAYRGSFLVEDKLLEFLKPYSDEQRALVRIDNIFSALRITDMAAVNKLIEYFKPYSYCPNCMRGISRKQLKKLYVKCKDADHRKSYAHVANDGTVCEELDDNSEGEEKPCDNHYLIVESAMVLTALNEFTSNQNKMYNEAQQRFSLRTAEDVPNESGAVTDSVCLVGIKNATIAAYWRKFMDYMPTEKQKLWKSLEHGLQHYLEVLKQREQLDKECASLRRQNAELKHLLQRFEI